MNAKAGDVKGKLQLESDFGTGSRDWGQGFDTYSVNNSGLGFREAWVMFPFPGVPVTVKAGHQLLQLGNGWFFRSQHYGSDAWVVFNDTGNNHLGFVKVMISEGVPPTGQGVGATQIASADDIDAYVIVDTYKINDNNKVGFDFTLLNDRRSGLGGGVFGGTSVEMNNLGLNYNGKIGPLASTTGPRSSSSEPRIISTRCMPRGRPTHASWPSASTPISRVYPTASSTST